MEDRTMEGDSSRDDDDDYDDDLSKGRTTFVRLIRVDSILTGGYARDVIRDDQYGIEGGAYPHDARGVGSSELRRRRRGRQQQWATAPPCRAFPFRRNNQLIGESLGTRREERGAILEDATT